MKFNIEGVIENKRISQAVIKKWNGKLLDWLPKRHAEDGRVALVEVNSIKDAQAIIREIGIGEVESEEDIRTYYLVPDTTTKAFRGPDYCN